MQALAWHITSVVVENIAGYRSVCWTRLDRTMNALFGVHASGKSSVLRAIAIGLRFGLEGKHSEDAFLRAFPKTRVVIEFASGDRVDATFDYIRRSASRDSSASTAIVQLIENRQSKSIVGKQRSYAVAHPTSRYPNAISELKRMHDSEEARDRALFTELFAVCREIDKESEESWDWLQKSFASMRPKLPQPASSGQFDLMALVLDLLRLRDQIAETSSRPHFVILDNPSSYLHPATHGPLISALPGILPNAQFFLAAHSASLLTHLPPKSLFWLSRRTKPPDGPTPQVDIVPVRALAGGTRQLFEELYGVGIESIVGSMLALAQNPDYARFLWQCLDDCQSIARDEPTRDRQLARVRCDLLGNSNATDGPVILDVGAGEGDLLVALVAHWREIGVTSPVYIGQDIKPTPELHGRLERYIATGAVNSCSRVIERLEDAPSCCSAIALINVCHALCIADLAKLLAVLFCNHTGAGTRIVIHEVQTLVHAERQFLVWHPEDFGAVFEESLHCGVEFPDTPDCGVPLMSSVVVVPEGFHARGYSVEDVRSRLHYGFCQRLSFRSEALLSELSELVAHDGGMVHPVHIRARRTAFVIAQIAWLALEARQVAVGDDSTHPRVRALTT